MAQLAATVTRVLAGLVAASLLFGCGGGKSSQTTTSTTVSNGSQAAQPMSGINAAPIPSNLRCGTTDIVWVNLTKRVYHESGDPYYGRTKHGQYMCRADAQAQGYRAAGTHCGGGAMNGYGANSSGGYSGNMTSGHKRHHKKSGYGGTMTETTPTP